jgi:hypothetical protein
MDSGRKRANKLLVCSGCGAPRGKIVASYEGETRALPRFEYLTTFVVELYRVRSPDCGVKAGKVPLLPGKAVSASVSRMRGRGP